MRKTIVIILAALIMSAASVFGQTIRELKLISTSPDELVRNGVAMEPKFDSEGNISRLMLINEADRGKKNTNGMNLIAGEAVEEIIDLLFPEQIRGKKTQTWGKYYDILGLMNEYRYEKIIVIALNGTEEKTGNITTITPRNNSIKPALAFVICFAEEECGAGYKPQDQKIKTHKPKGSANKTN